MYRRSTLTCEIHLRQGQVLPRVLDSVGLAQDHALDEESLEGLGVLQPAQRVQEVRHKPGIVQMKHSCNTSVPTYENSPKSYKLSLNQQNSSRSPRASILNDSGLTEKSLAKVMPSRFHLCMEILPTIIENVESIAYLHKAVLTVLGLISKTISAIS